MLDDVVQRLLQNSKQTDSYFGWQMRRISGNASGTTQVYDIDIWCGCLLGRNDREQERDIIKRISEEHSAVYSP
jgi:hypothetical protein